MAFERVKNKRLFVYGFSGRQGDIPGAFTEELTSAMGADSTPAASPPDAVAAASQPGPKEMANDPSRTGFDPQMKWWMNYFKILSGQMTPEGMFHFREWRYTVHEERDCKRCEEYRDWLFTYSLTVSNLL